MKCACFDATKACIWVMYVLLHEDVSLVIGIYCSNYVYQVYWHYMYKCVKIHKTSLHCLCLMHTGFCSYNMGLVVFSRFSVLRAIQVSLYPCYICRLNYVQFKITQIFSILSIRYVVKLWYVADLWWFWWDCTNTVQEM